MEIGRALHLSNHIGNLKKDFESKCTDAKEILYKKIEKKDNPKSQKMKTPIIESNSPGNRSKLRNQSFGLIDQNETNPNPD